MIVGVLGLVISMLLVELGRLPPPDAHVERGAAPPQRRRGARPWSRSRTLLPAASSVALARETPTVEVAGDIPGDLRVLLQPAEQYSYHWRPKGT